MYRVLLVEDEEIELETLRDYIDWEKNGISRVFTARNGRRALECLEENMADIVITDIQMPGMSGIEPKAFAREVYNLYMYLWNRLILSDELLESWMKAEKEFHESEIFEADNSYQLREKMEQYLERMLEFFEKQNQNPSYYAVCQVKTYLQEHCSESADIEKLAADVGLSPNYLRSLFKEATGKTILEYNTEMRLQKAAELLKDKKNKVREVSLAVGYENVSYFGVVFQKRFGVTPNEYRKMV